MGCLGFGNHFDNSYGGIIGMTTQTLIERLRNSEVEDILQSTLLDDAADALEAQATEIERLDAGWSSCADALVKTIKERDEYQQAADKMAAAHKLERDALRAELAALKAQEPVIDFTILHQFASDQAISYNKLRTAVLMSLTQKRESSDDQLNPTTRQHCQILSGCTPTPKPVSQQKKQLTLPTLSEVELIRLTGKVQELAVSIWSSYYRKTAPDWTVSGDRYGALSQISNMVAGMRVSEPAAVSESVNQVLLEAVKSFHAWAYSQFKQQSKGGHASFDFMELIEQIDIADVAIKAAHGITHGGSKLTKQERQGFNDWRNV
jgi:hypothetical protein